MPFYSRHSSDGRDRFLGDIHDEEEYDRFMKMILSVATLQMKYKVIMIVQKQMLFRLQAAKKKRVIRQRNKKKHRKYYKERNSSNHTCVESCGKKLFPTALISKEMNNLKDV